MNQKTKQRLTRLINLWDQVVNPRNWPSLFSEMIWFITSLRKYRHLCKTYGVMEAIEVEPVISQRVARSNYDPHYIYQAVWATKRIVDCRPKSHVDVSSQVQFGAQLSAMLPVLVLEFRPPELISPGYQTQHADILSLPLSDQSVESLSCLHVVEHIGLGRYGDHLDPLGPVKALAELSRVVAPGGFLYLSVPVGKPRVCFNAHRIFRPEFIPEVLDKMLLVEFSLVNDLGSYLTSTAMETAKDLRYGCGLYWFRKR